MNHFFHLWVKSLCILYCRALSGHFVIKFKIARSQVQKHLTQKSTPAHLPSTANAPHTPTRPQLSVFDMQEFSTPPRVTHQFAPGFISSNGYKFLYSVLHNWAIKPWFGLYKTARFTFHKIIWINLRLMWVTFYSKMHSIIRFFNIIASSEMVGDWKWIVSKFFLPLNGCISKKCVHALIVQGTP